MNEQVISISDAGWTKWLATFATATRKTFREALYEEWPLLLRRVMDFTPPFKSKGRSGVSDLSVGRKAVAFDIYKTMRPFAPIARTKALEGILARGDLAAYNVLASRATSAEMRGTTAIAFSPEQHLRQRDYRGRVPGRDRRKVVIGADAARLNRYVKERQNWVGYAKSGWLKALLLVGGDAPGYVTKHGTGGGDVIDDHANEDEPSITAINRTPWAVRKDEGERILADATTSRIAAIKKKVAAAVRLADEQARRSA